MILSTLLNSWQEVAKNLPDIALMVKKKMKIWIDADACPVAVKEILYKASDRTGIAITLVANQYQRITSPSSRINFIKVEKGLDVADNYIVNNLDPGDLVITNDIPLAALVIEKEAHALSPRGEMFNKDEIRSRLSMRDFMESLRDSGVDTGGPPPLHANDKKQFASALDRFLTKHKV